jgi:hypothetical protein
MPSRSGVQSSSTSYRVLLIRSNQSRSKWGTEEDEREAEARKAADIGGRGSCYALMGENKPFIGLAS